MNKLNNNQMDWEYNINYWKNQISNSREHLNRNWELLKNPKNLSSADFREIGRNIEIEDKYLKECEVKLFEARWKSKKHPWCWLAEINCPENK